MSKTDLWKEFILAYSSKDRVHKGGRQPEQET